MKVFKLFYFFLLFIVSFTLIKPIEAAPQAILVFKGISPNPVEPGQIVTISGQGFGEVGHLLNSNYNLDGNYMYLSPKRGYDDYLDGQYFPLITWSDTSISFLISEELIVGQEITVTIHKQDVLNDISIPLTLNSKPLQGPPDGHLTINFSTTCGDENRPYPNRLVLFKYANNINDLLMEAYTDADGVGTIVRTINPLDAASLQDIDVEAGIVPPLVPAKPEKQFIRLDSYPYKDETIDLAPFHYSVCPQEDISLTPTPEPVLEQVDVNGQQVWPSVPGGVNVQLPTIGENEFCFDAYYSDGSHECFPFFVTRLLPTPTITPTETPAPTPTPEFNQEDNSGSSEEQQPEQ